MLRYFAAILPPADVSQHIVESIQNVANEDIATATSMDIKVAFHEGLDPFPQWEPIMGALAEKTKPFEVKFGKPEFIGEYLIALPIISEELLAMHAKSVEMMHTSGEVEAMSPDQKAAFFESQSIFIPHLRLASGLFGSGWNQKKILKKISSKLGELKSFTATDLTLYEALVYDRNYVAKGTIALGQPDAKLKPADGLLPIAA